jgi:cysteine-rich repeat protein
MVEGDELCDGEDLGGQDCSAVGGNGAGLACSPDCAFDATNCEGFSMCGNGEIESLEQCDDDNLNEETCESLTGKPDGALQCTGCVFNTTNCCLPLEADCNDDADCCSNNCEGVDFVLDLKQCA